MERLRKFFRDEEGATSVEYALMAALIAMVVIGAVTIVGTNLSTKFESMAAELASAS
jgi:pilus assembly protein Flp/PilA